MIFKTFDSDLDGISNKLGFSKRSFSEWIKQVKTSFIGGTNVLQKFKNTLSAAFIADKNGENNTWITNSSGQIISNDNIDLYLPKLDQVPASNLLRNMQTLQAQVDAGTLCWDDYFSALDENQKWQIDFIQNNNLQTASTKDLIKANEAARASILNHNKAIKAQTLSAKAGKAALQALATAGNMLAGFVISKIFESVITNIDNYVHKAEKANDAMDNAISAYGSAKSSLDSINSELDEHIHKISDLESKDKLTYAEKGQLDELKAITQELLLQQSINEKRTDKASKEAADKTVDAYDTQYGKYDISKEGVDKRFEYNDFPTPQSEDDITGNIAAYISINKAKEDSENRRRDALESGMDVTSIDEEIQDYIDAADEYSARLDSSISDLQEKRLALEDEYRKAIEKDQNGGEMTSSETKIIDTYDAITDDLKIIYGYTNPNEWNSIEFSEIFNADGIEKNREELISMYQSGELSSEEMLKQFPKLSNFLSANGLHQKEYWKI